VRIRPARIADVEAVAPLLGELGYPASEDQARRRLGRLLDDDAARVWVAADGDAVVGLVAMRSFWVLERDEPNARLLDIVVRGDRRGSGVGARLVAEVVAEAERRGCYRVEVMSGAARRDAHRFYEACGFAERPKRFVRVLRP
jgi:GNAT superfamily N-acetyltransferase